MLINFAVAGFASIDQLQELTFSLLRDKKLYQQNMSKIISYLV